MQKRDQNVLVCFESSCWKVWSVSGDQIEQAWKRAHGVENEPADELDGKDISVK